MLERKSQQFQDLSDDNGQILISIKENEEESTKYPPIQMNSTLNMSKNSIHDEISEVIVEMKAPDFSLRQDQVSQNSRVSFSALNDSVNQSPFTSKVGSKISYSNQFQYSKQMNAFNQSIFTEKRQLQQSLRAKPAPQIHEELNQPINYQQSFYLTKKQEPINEKIHNNNKIHKESENQIKVVFRTQQFCIELGKECVKVNIQSLQNLYNQLFKRQLFVPLFSHQIYDNWFQMGEVLRKYDEKSEAFIHLKVYLDKYVGYLNQHCLKYMQEVLETVKMIQIGCKDKKKQVYSYFQFDLKSLLDNVKHFIAETKTEVLRKTLLYKLKSMVEAINEGQKYKISAEEKLNLQKAMQRTWIELGNIQLLLSFQRTIEYCTKKIENSPQTKFKQIWIKYREMMTRERSKFVSKLDLINL